MARVILEQPGEDIFVGGAFNGFGDATDTTVIGTRTGGEEITVIRGDIVLDASFNAGGDVIRLPGEAEDYTAVLQGSRVILTSVVNQVRISIPVGENPITIIFGGDDSRQLEIENGQVIFGGQVITGTTITLDPVNDTALTLGLTALRDSQAELDEFLRDNGFDSVAEAEAEADACDAELAAARAIATDSQLNADINTEQADVEAARTRFDAADARFTPAIRAAFAELDARQARVVQEQQQVAAAQGDAALQRQQANAADAAADAAEAADAFAAQQRAEANAADAAADAAEAADAFAAQQRAEANVADAAADAAEAADANAVVQRQQANAADAAADAAEAADAFAAQQRAEANAADAAADAAEAADANAVVQRAEANAADAAADAAEAADANAIVQRQQADAAAAQVIVEQADVTAAEIALETANPGIDVIVNPNNTVTVTDGVNFAQLIVRNPVTGDLELTIPAGNPEVDDLLLQLQELEAAQEIAAQEEAEAVAAELLAAQTDAVILRNFANQQDAEADVAEANAALTDALALRAFANQQEAEAVLAEANAALTDAPALRAFANQQEVEAVAAEQLAAQTDAGALRANANLQEAEAVVAEANAALTNAPALRAAANQQEAEAVAAENAAQTDAAALRAFANQQEAEAQASETNLALQQAELLVAQQLLIQQQGVVNTLDPGGVIRAEFLAAQGNLAVQEAELRAAVEAFEERLELIEECEEARDLADEAGRLEGIRDDARDDLVDDFGFETVQIVDNDQVDEQATAGDDAFIFASEDGLSEFNVINNFGDQGNDVLFVGDGTTGEGFTLVRIPQGVEVGVDEVGDPNALEIFIQQQGDDTVLFIEERPFGGSATQGGFNGDIIVLSGTDADEVNLTSQGLIVTDSFSTTGA